MKKIVTLILVSVLILALAGCGSKDSGVKDDLKKPQDNTSTNSSTSNSDTLPASYPKEKLPLAVDAEIIDVRENPASKGLEVIYVSDNNINTLRDFYEGALKGAKDLITDETPEGYMISATLDGVGYTIMLSKDAMKSNPKYAEKVSVYIILSGLEDISEAGPQIPMEKGETWPTADLPGVPIFEGHIDKILRDDNIIYLDITVDNADVVKSYIGDLTEAGFTFDAEPKMEDDYLQYFAFKGDSVLNFDYDGKEKSVGIEYHK